MTTTSDITFEHSVRENLLQLKVTAVRALASGQIGSERKTSGEAYWDQVGYLRGLEDAKKACDEAHRLISGEEPRHDTATRLRMSAKDKATGVLG